MSTFGKSFSFSGGASGSSTAAPGGFGSFNQTTNQAGGLGFGASTEKRQRSGTATEATPFGAQSNAGGTFGQNAFATPVSTAAPASSWGTFGSTQPTTTGAPTGGLFGSSSTLAPSTTSLFGSTPSQPAQQSSSLFGGTSSQPAQQTSSLFGNASSQPAHQTSLFGNVSAQPTQPTSLFGSGLSGSLFGSQQSAQQPLVPVAPAQPQPVQPSSEAEELSNQIMFIKNCWDPALPSYQFRHYFYNVAEPGQAHLYQCPPGQDPVLWQQAQADNPDPTTLVPVLANGFDDLRKRVDSQSLQMQSYQERTSEISGKLCDILQKHHSETTVRLAECRRRQGELSQRLLEFMRLLQLLRLRGQLLHPEEEIFRVRVEHLEKEMARSGSLKQRFVELQDHAYRLQANARRRRELLGLSGAGHAADGYEVADATQLESVMKMLSEKQRGLAHLTQVVSQDSQVIDTIEDAIEVRYNDVQKQRDAREQAQVAGSLIRPW
ncbi:Nucleoporin nup57 [Coemansia furcata]|uniref:Nucleoporin nup57 n=1 Tax=Coemansia furcata TaxID=417177 RepID=A0ACC1LLE9_9FUNG|nr:Nucleoporin nup57 [Coemansia furcata]